MADLGLTLTDIADARVFEQYIFDSRSWRLTNHQDWKRRMRDTDALYRGDWAMIWPDESQTLEKPAVMNLVETAMGDIAKLVSETTPAIRCPAQSDSNTQEKRANVREGIAHSYADVNDWDLLEPQLSMDLSGAGAAFVAAGVDEYSPYPCWTRLDPRYCYPDFHNGILIDLLTIQTIRVRQLGALFPQLGETMIAKANALGLAADSDACEVIQYFSKATGATIAAYLVKDDKPQDGTLAVANTWDPGTGAIPVAWAKLPTYDGAIRGMFDQVGGSLLTKNRIMKLMLDYADELVYAPFEELGVLNADETPGPKTVYHLDPNAQGARMGRVPPAGSSPELMGMLDYLDREQRGGTSYPASRTGEISQSQGSASFVASTMGALTSTVRAEQSLLAGLRKDLNTISFALDEKHLNKEKPLLRPVGTKSTYKPSDDIAGEYMNLVIYGAGAGLDRLNADVRILQFKGAGMLSAESAGEQVDFISDPVGEQEKVQREMVSTIALQKFLQEAPVDQVNQVYLLMDKGKTFAEALEVVQKQAADQAQAQQAAQAQAQAQGLPPGGEPATEQAAMQKGAAPGPQPAFAPPPLENVLVGQ